MIQSFTHLLFLILQGGTALIDASYNGNVEVVKLLLALPGIDYNHETNKVRDSCDMLAQYCFDFI
jgi:hypothetical protein